MIPKDRNIYGRFIGQPISANDLLSDLPVKNKKRLRTICRRIEISEGEALTERGDFSKTVLILQSGNAELSFTNHLNDRIYRRQLERKEIIGLRRLFANPAQQKNILALSRCNFDIFPADEFFAVLKNDSDLNYRLLEILSFDINRSYREFTEMSF